MGTDVTYLKVMLTTNPKPACRLVAMAGLGLLEETIDDKGNEATGDND
jgi:hypothetical protein